MYAVDLHAHTRFFHGFERAGTAFDPFGYRLLALAARARGLDGVALTNHDYCTPFEGGGVASIPGIEVTTTEGHVLVVGPDPPRRTRPGELTPNAVVSMAHDRDCAVILPHPFRRSKVRHSDADFDAVELNGKSRRAWDAAREVAADRALPLVGGSDAHYPFEVGRSYTRVDAESLAPADVADAIRGGHVEPAFSRDPVSRALSRVYDRLHARKGHHEQF
ncbi:PHP-associated domain-containing protein [Halobacterium zhouii]|uniref:PHP-associated domain-containing protein n=1 Tax=Halobacterium zhouii TaxID=2902624 RepID=UPI001E36EC1B|nr:PHP-associated domain-containing protein [Halobacterium zhouii]